MMEPVTAPRAVTFFGSSQANSKGQLAARVCDETSSTYLRIGLAGGGIVSRHPHLAQTYSRGMFVGTVADAFWSFIPLGAPQSRQSRDVGGRTWPAIARCAPMTSVMTAFVYRSV
jgi:hypothetical protein